MCREFTTLIGEPTGRKDRKLPRARHASAQARVELPLVAEAAYPFAILAMIGGI